MLKHHQVPNNLSNIHGLLADWKRPLTSYNSASNHPCRRTAAAAAGCVRASPCQHTHCLLPAVAPVPAIFLQALRVQILPAHARGVAVLNDEVSCCSGLGCAGCRRSDGAVLAGVGGQHNCHILQEDAVLEAFCAVWQGHAEGRCCADEVPALLGKLR